MINSLAIVVGELVAPERLRAAQDRFPFLEWGVPVQNSEWTPERRDWLVQARRQGLRLVAHVSGPLWIESLMRGHAPGDVPGFAEFSRVQFNIGKSPQFKPANFYPNLMRQIGPAVIARNLAAVLPSPVRFIFQVRGGGRRSPELDEVVQALTREGREAAFLFDARGRTFDLESWPQPPEMPCPVGYAGGIAPGNIARAFACVQARVPADRACWLDLESGVKDDSGHFSFDRLEDLCRTFAALI